MRGPTLLAWQMLPLLLVVAACDSDESGPFPCTPGTSFECTCPGGESGSQVCLDQGYFDVCSCPGDADASDVDVSDVDADSGTADTDDGADADVLPDVPVDVAEDADTGGDADAGEDTEVTVSLESIEVGPKELVLEVDLLISANRDFAATGNFSDGSSRDITDEVVWSHDNSTLGTITGGTLEIPAFDDVFVGSTIIRAELEGSAAEAQLTVIAYAQTGDDAAGLLVLPYGAPADTDSDSLTFDTELSRMDVFVAMDTTGSMGGPIAAIQASFDDGLLDAIRTAVADTQFGVGAYQDFPISPFGTPSCFATGAHDQPFVLLQEITSATETVLAAAEGWLAGSSPSGCGADGPESTIEAVYQLATGDGLTGPAPTSVAANDTGIGGVGFREGAQPVAVVVTDAQTHDPGHAMCGFGTDYDSNPSVLAVAHTRDEMVAALQDICARVVTVAVSNFDPSCGPYADGLYLADETGTRVPPQAWDLFAPERPTECGAEECCTGLDGAGVAPDDDGLCPLVYRVPFGGTGAGVGFSEGVRLVATGTPVDVTFAVTGSDSDYYGDDLPGELNTADYIRAVTADSAGDPPIEGMPVPTATDDGFSGVIPGTSVTFAVEGANDVFESTSSPKLFEVTLSISAGTCAALGERSVLIVVPPSPLDG